MTAGSGVGSSLDRRAADIVGSFQEAAIGQADWETAITLLADATGSKTGELIGLGPDSVVPFNLMTNAAPEAATQFVAAGGGDPAVNSRVRVGVQARELEVLDEAAFTTRSDIRLNPAYADWVRDHEMTHVCLTTLVKEEGLLVGMALARTARQGDIDLESKRLFAAVAPHARRAVRTRMALEDQRLSMMVGGLDAVRATVFLCDATRRVRAMTRAAEALVAHGGPLWLTNGRLTVADSAQGGLLDLMIGDVLTGGSGGRTPVAIRGDALHDGVLVEIAPAPGHGVLGFNDCVLVIVQQPSQDDQRIAAAARALYGLSPSEAAIAAQLALGRPVAGIAGQRQVSVGTVRSQVRSIFDKMEVSSQIELAARLTLYR